MKTKVKFDYRHYICIVITIGFVLCSIFIFPYAFGRIIESVRDLGLSVAYYFTELFEFSGIITPTVNNFTVYPIENVFTLPFTWDEFKLLWSEFWEKIGSPNNFDNYLYFLNDLAEAVSKFLLLIIPLVFAVIMMFRRYFETENNDYNKDSSALKKFKKFTALLQKPIDWLKNFFLFAKSKWYYWKLWLFIWAFNFNLITIFIEFLAYYFYFVISFDLIGLYRQVFKLLVDISPMISFVPLLVWCVVGLLLFDKIRKNIAKQRLQHYERKDRGFINSRPIVVMICGTMGKKKTTMLTDIAISQDIMLRDKAFEKLLENDLKFPNFPWCNLENVLKRAIAKHTIYNLATTKKFINHLRAIYYLSVKNPDLNKSLRRHLKHSYGITYENLLFDYDYEKYGFTYNDKLKVVDVWDVIETYSQLYFIYVIQSSLILSNYSIRTDNIISDLGNFPLWDTDFFNRDSRLLDSYSRHAHILDFDMLRLGRKVILENQKSNAFEFGVVVITEVGKERGNNLELQEKKKKDEGTNQKNDLFNYTLKMIRHSATVDNFPFVRVITDEQRPQSWGADARDLCDVIYIVDSGEPQLALPFFELEELLYKWFFSKFSDLYYRYRYVRSDNTLPMYLLKAITAKINRYYSGICNLYGYCRLSVSVGSGDELGETSCAKYYLMNKKIYSKRFSTDCFSDFYMAKSLRSSLGLDDLDEFKCEKASLEELMQENAYFMNDILLGLKNGDKE